MMVVHILEVLAELLRFGPVEIFCILIKSEVGRITKVLFHIMALCFGFPHQSMFLAMPLSVSRHIVSTCMSLLKENW